MNQITPLAANPDRRCDCCRRYHRRLQQVNGYWLGQDCANEYRLYLRIHDRKNIVWHGHETKFSQIETMLGQNTATTIPGARG